MTDFDPATLRQFTGTTAYWRISKRHCLTDGSRYVAETLGAFWLMDLIGSHLVTLDTADPFVSAHISVSNSQAVVSLEEGNGSVRRRQVIPYTDFALSELVLFCCWDGAQWITMLPSEY